MGLKGLKGQGGPEQSCSRGFTFDVQDWAR